MSHLYLQEDPKVSVGGANDVASTIPTPEQLGSLLLTYAATGSTGQTAAAYGALEVNGAPQWVPIASAVPDFDAGPSGIDHVTGDVTTASGFPTYVTLNHSNIDATPVAVPITAPIDGFLLIDFDSSSSTTAVNTDVGNAFRLLLDGVPITNSDRGSFASASNADAVFDVSINARVAVLAGLHTVTVEWCATPGDTARILRGSDAGFEGATLRAEFIRT